MLNWLVHDRGIEPHIPVFDKSQRTDGTFSRETSPTTRHRPTAARRQNRSTIVGASPYRGPASMKDNSMRYRASKRDCQACQLKPRCCPKAPARKISRSIYEGARDLAREVAKTEAYRPRGVSAKRSRCCSHTSSAF